MKLAKTKKQKYTKNQLSLIITSHRIDQETGAAFIVDVKPTNEYGVYNVWMSFYKLFWMVRNSTTVNISCIKKT